MHRHNSLAFAFFILSLLTNTGAYAQWSFDELNVAHQYDPQAEVNLYAQQGIEGDSLTLYTRLVLNQSKSKLSDYAFEVFPVRSLSQKLNSATSFDSTFITSDNSSHIFKLTTSYSGEKWVIIRVLSKFSGFSFYFNFPITTNSDLLVKKGNYPVVSAFLKPDKYSISKSAYCFYYQYEFANALPPMITQSPLPEKEFKPDSIFKIERKQNVLFENQGLYFLQPDTTKLTGHGFVVKHKYYPQLATLPHLIEPLVYITTRKEKERLDHITTKKEFDQFWLDLTQSPDRAKKIIKEFYDRTEHANLTFTSFKEGWKTDRGMIYIIFGLPDELLKSDTDETWIYLGNNRRSKIKFRFIKTDNIFSSSHYSLIRDKKYDGIWFRAVDLWRKSRF